jgi:hypothetical protein
LPDREKNAMNLATFVRCLRQAYYTGTGFPAMKVLVHNYQSLDWFSPDLYRGPVLHTDLSENPHIKFVSFTDEDQETDLSPGFIAMMDGACELNKGGVTEPRRLHLNECVVSSTGLRARSLHPQVTLLHIGLEPGEVFTSSSSGGMGG